MNENIVLSMQKFLKSILSLDDIKAILVPEQKNIKNKNTLTGLMPALITDPSHIDRANPIAPAFAINAAKLVSKLTHKPMGKKIAVVMRPCEIRALIELVKLKQASIDDIIIISFDCPGAYTNKDLAKLSFDDSNDFTHDFCKDFKEISLSSACLSCENFTGENADISMELIGRDLSTNLFLNPLTKKGKDILNQLDISFLDQDIESSKRDTALAEILARKSEFKEKMFEKINEKTNKLEKLSEYFAACVNCYNCRVACPVCYCKECVFNTDVFVHDPYQYMQWAKRKGSIKLPADTSFYHITRLAHMSLACVGCGQCSNACPNDINVMELFKYIGEKTQSAFEYEAGKDINQPPPLSVFKEEEYPEIVGIN